MRVVKVEYLVKEEYVETNKTNIRRVMEDLRKNPIDGMNYSSFYLGEGKFMHLNISSNEESGKELNQREAFTEFRMALKGSQPLSPPNQENPELVGSSVDLV